MSNMARVFLGTRIECAQCHDHPFEPITQKDFYQLTAYTYGVSNLYTSSGYSTDNVRHWPELTAKLDAMNAGKALRDAASGTVAPLKRLTKDTEHQLFFPDHYLTDATDRGKPVEARTPFGDEAPALGNRRVAFAQWMTSPRNPRFTRNIANRLFKRVMGVGLIEPVDSLSPVNRPEQPELLDFLTQTMARLRYDERAFLAVLLNTRLYQSEAERKELEPGEAFALRGPLLRRLSAEQLWDSLLVLLVEDLDARKPLPPERGLVSREQLVQPGQHERGRIAGTRSQVMAEYHAARRRHNIDLENQKIALKQATDAGDSEKVRRLREEHAQDNAPFERMHQALQMGGPSTSQETDPRWHRLSPVLVRASEIPTPIALGHFLRQFGQSDRREIDAFSKNPNITHCWL